MKSFLLMMKSNLIASENHHPSVAAVIRGDGSGSHINLRFGSNDERLGGSVRQSRRMSGSDLSYKQSEMEFRDHILNIRRLQRAESKGRRHYMSAF